MGLPWVGECLGMKPYNLQKISVLVLEKHELIRNLFKDVFREFGVWDLHMTDCPKRAYRTFQDKPTDLIMTDWTPDFDGLGFLERIRKDHESPNPYVPVIVVSAHSEMPRVIRARDAGMHEFLVKPVSAKSIYARICSVVERNRPFVRCKDFFGPDRRRRQADYKGPDRRGNSVLSQAQVAALMQA